MRATLLGLILVGTALDARAERIFYRAGTWLETSAEVQRLSLRGVLQGWERVASEVEATALPGQPLSRRQWEAVRLSECLGGPARRPITELQEHVTAFAAADPGRVFYSLSDFLAEGLKPLCPPR